MQADDIIYQHKKPTECSRVWRLERVLWMKRDRWILVGWVLCVAAPCTPSGKIVHPTVEVGGGAVGVVDLDMSLLKIGKSFK